MGFSIPNPELTLRERARIAFWAWADAKFEQPSISEEPCLESNRIASFANKAREAISHEIASQGNAKRHKRLKGLYSQYLATLSKFRHAQAERNRTVAKAKGEHFPEDDELDRSAFERRSSARAAKSAHHIELVIAELENKLDQMAIAANEKDALADYQGDRVELSEHCAACVERFYYRTGNVYAQALRRRLGMNVPLRIPEFNDSACKSEIDAALPVLDFTQHHKQSGNEN